MEVFQEEITRPCHICKKQFKEEEFYNSTTVLCKPCFSAFNRKRYEQIKDKKTQCECGEAVKIRSLKLHRFSKRHQKNLTMIKI